MPEHTERIPAQLEGQEVFLEVIKRDFRVMPQLAITVDQGSRLWSIERSASRELLDSLVSQGFLRRRHDGRYALQMTLVSGLSPFLA